jgi:hypothetical protein
MNVQWHAEPEAVSRYASGELDEARMYSLEAHVLACDRCRGLLSPLADAGAIERVWSAVEEAVDDPRPGVVERTLLRLGVPDHQSRLLAATPSLRLSWFAALAVVLAFAALAARGNRPGLVIFLALAPLIPVAGIAAAFGPGVDPTFEIGLAAPLRSSKLLLIRCTAVLVASLVLIGLAALTLPSLDWIAAAWLLPALALTLVTLAVSTVAEPLPSAVGVALVWVISVVLVGHFSGDGVAAFRVGGQELCLALIVLSGAILTHRFEAFERREA